MFGTKAQIEKLARKNPNIKFVVIAGSYGKKSAIRALGEVLSQTYVVTMGVNKNIIPEIVLLDLASMAVFPNITPDLVVITSCANSDDANRFFEIANRAQAVLVNYDDVPQEYANLLTNQNLATYGDELPADFYFENHEEDLKGFRGNIVDPNQKHFPVNIRLLGEHNLRPIVMAFAAAQLFYIPEQKIINAIDAIEPLNGRMQVCRGMRGSIVIDDSADTSATSVYFGLRTIYAIDAPSRIVVTDDLSKLGDFDQSHIDEVVVYGPAISHNITNAKISFFEDLSEMINYLGQHFEENGIVLLEIPLPEIIEGDFES